MEFKKQGASFSSSMRFSDDMKRFVADEAARFTTESNEAASASMDGVVEHALIYSKSKNVGKRKEQQKILDEIKTKKKEEKSGNNSSIHPSQDKFVDPTPKEKDVGPSKFEESKESSMEGKAEADKKFTSDSKENDARKGTTDKDISAKEKEAKKTKSKETKRAATKTALANVFRAKKELSNDLVREEVSGDALKDGSKGLVSVFIEAVNPMRFVREWLAKLAGIVAPYLLSFMLVFSILLMIIFFIFSVLQPIAEVGAALENFISFFTGDSGMTTSALSDSEIDSIVEDSGADETTEVVIRYALSKVGYPYSQEHRTSGNAYDCSSLVYYSWKDADVDISFGSGYPPTAAEGARMLEANGKKLATMDLKPGDLVYYGGEGNGRYMGIYHVALYVGEGMVVEALNETYGVVYQKLRTNNAIMVCRPE